MMERIGPSSGTYRGASIPDWIESRGSMWDFDRTCLGADQIDLRTLSPDELVIYPGLIYRRRTCPEFLHDGGIAAARCSRCGRPEGDHAEP